MPHRIRTLLIEDSAFMRIVLSDLLRRDASIQLVATAMNGLDGVIKARTLLPDVIVSDMVMPLYDGLFVVEQVMKERPVPIILLSALGRADEKIFVALENGAFDFVDKPKEKEMANGFKTLLEMVHQASMAGCVGAKGKLSNAVTLTHEFRSTTNHDIVVIGASTGGPGAVEVIVCNLPINMPVPVIIAQHMPQRFIDTFAERLSRQRALQVTVARNGEPLKSNHVYLAPGIANMRVDMSEGFARASYDENTYPEYNYPSINCLFESVAEELGHRSIGVILTGMGKDGANGLKKIRDAGGLTITQDETSSVVYGMPKAAYENGASRYQIPLSKIANFITTAL
jgi:two-component system, chemotaxis family, protein-glutamate methylesterase/glutaminase